MPSTARSVAPAGHNFEMVCKRDFDLSPREVATLAAIIAYNAHTGRPMPRYELEYMATQDPLVDLSLPGNLASIGLIKLKGGHSFRYYDATAAALVRLSR